MYEALQFHLEGISIDGEEIPEGSVTAVYLAIPDPTLQLAGPGADVNGGH
jgi:hypothetical protein